MKIKKYFAADMRQALNLAREEHGPDVLILGNNKVLGGVEIITSDEYNVDKAEDVLAVDSATAALHEEISEQEDYIPSHPVQDIPQPKPEITRGMIYSQENGLEQMQRELNIMRQLLETQMSGLAWGDAGRRHPLWTALLHKFGMMGIGPGVADRLVQQVPEDYEFDQAWRTSLALLGYQIPIMRDELLVENKAIVLAGASGVGKTTMMAKLAANFVLENSSTKIVLATMDSYRVGGREQLGNYARILGIPLRIINNKDDIEDLFDRFYGKKLILIDTAGLSPNDTLREDQNKIIRSIKAPVTTALVLSAASQDAAIKHVIDVHRPLNPTVCMLTKLDEATSIGGVLSEAIKEGLKIAYHSSGQKVPDDIEKAETSDLISRAISVMKRHEGKFDERIIEREIGRHAVLKDMRD